MKLSNLGATPPQEFELLDPFTQEPTGIKITIHPIKSRIGKQAEHVMRQSILKLMQDESNMIEVDGNKSLKVELIKEVSIQMLTDLTVSWNGIEDDNGEPIKFSKKACKKAYLENEEFTDAVYEYANDLGNFLKA